MAELLTMLYNRGGFLGVRVCGHETADFEMLLKSYENSHHISASNTLDVIVVVVDVFTFNNCSECTFVH